MKRLARFLLVTLACLLCVFVLLVAWRADGEASEAAILLGDCANCLFEEVRFGPDAIVVTGTASQRIWSQGQLDGLLATSFSVRENTPGGVSLVGLHYIDGNQRQAVPEAVLASMNRQCAVEGNDAACRKARESLDIRFTGIGTFVVQIRSRIVSGFAGGHRSWRRTIPEGWLAPRYGLAVASHRRLFGDGDLEASPDGLAWHYQDRGRGFVALGTTESWSDVADAYGRMEARIIAEGKLALDGIPAAPADASLEAAMQQHWLWIRRNLEYRRNPNLLDGAMAPSPLATTFGRGWGDCKDFALVLRALLQRDGFQAETTLVDSRVRDDEPDTRIPTARVDHAIVYLPQLGRYVDPTLAGTSPVPTGGRVPYSFAVRPRSEPQGIDRSLTEFIRPGETTQ